MPLNVNSPERRVPLVHWARPMPGSFGPVPAWPADGWLRFCCSLPSRGPQRALHDLPSMPSQAPI